MLRIALITICLIGSCSVSFVSGASQSQNLLDARKGFSTELLDRNINSYRFDEPPSDILSIVEYPTSLGNMSAYLTKPTKKGKKFPAIIWITGGLPVGGASSSVWETKSTDNDQSAKSYWQHGVISMYPSFRGSFNNPGRQEGFYGEVNDVLSALEYLSKVEYVDPERIYLGGHSTGATLTLLVAAATDKFRAVFAFGPAADPKQYGEKYRFHTDKNSKESYLRAPINFLSYIKSPTYIIEGVNAKIYRFNELKGANRNTNVQFFSVDKGNHFNILFPTNRLIASKLSTMERFELTQSEVQEAFDDIPVAQRELQDLRILSNLRSEGIKIDSILVARYLVLSRELTPLESSVKEINSLGFSTNAIKTHKDSDGKTYYSITASKNIIPTNLTTVSRSSRDISAFALQNGFYYQGWGVK